MKLVTVNAGSSSLRLSVFGNDGHSVQCLNAGHYPAAADFSSDRLRKLLVELDALDADVLIHRVVHGGDHLKSTCIIDDDVESEIERLIPLAPLHNGASLPLIRFCRDIFGPGVSQLAVFDTAFYGGMPPVASTYALPQALCRRFGIRRYGFHGLAHHAMWSAWRVLNPDLDEGGKVISMQLGSGCSITAVDRGVAVDTSMGFTPLEGLVMATRSGDVDPGLLIYLLRECRMSVEELDRILNHEAGLLGLSGISDDMHKLLENTDPESRLAVDVFCYRIRKYLGAYLAVLGGCDAILLGGGIGENSPVIRSRIFANLEWCGIGIDETSNLGKHEQPLAIHSSHSRCSVWVIPVDEAQLMAREAIDFLQEHS